MTLITFYFALQLFINNFSTQLNFFLTIKSLFLLIVAMVAAPCQIHSRLFLSVE